ncbi:MAG: VWA domain-containing protein [Bergeyella zoohelcum]|nr:VWA domain-containing protein [Bergeyella zoohelcum]
MSDFEFHSPWFLLLFLLFIPLIIKDLRRNKKQGIAVPTTSNMQVSRSVVFVLFFLKLTKYLALSALIIAMARPRTYTITDNQDDTKGVDIMLAVDVSLSMLSKDLEPDRLEALKKIAVDFVRSRPTDRIGLVNYSGEALAKVPLTTDHNVVTDEITNIDPMELTPGTAIGEGLSVAVSHLQHSKSKTKIVILMTDGVNTVENAMNPLVAADLAQSLGIKVYTIGIGTNGFALMPTDIDIFGDLVFTETEVKIDEPILLDIARKTGGKYYRATSNIQLKEVYDEINKMEKSDIKSSQIYNYEEYFRWFLLIAFAVFLLDALLRWLLYKTIM